MKELIQKVVKLSRSETTQDLGFELEKLYDLKSEIYDALESGRGENALTDYNLLVGLFYNFDSWGSYGENNLDGVKKFKEKFKKI